jgi:signal transduction histidine kinase/PAS domain-containing protein
VAVTSGGKVDSEHAREGQALSLEEEILALNGQLRQRVDELDTLLKILPVAVWIGNADCTQIRGNPAAYRIMGLSPGINASMTSAEPEVPGGMKMFVDGREVAPESAPMQRVARSGQAWNNVECELRFPDGTTTTVYGSVAPLFDDRGRVRQVIGAYADYTGRKRADEERRKAVDAERWLLQGVLSAIDDGVTVQDAAGKLIFANASAARLVGFESPEALLSTPVAEILRRFDICGEDGAPLPFDKLPSRAIFNGEPSAPVVVQYVVAGKGERRWSHFQAYPVLDSQGKLARVVSVFRDVTDEHHEQARRRLLQGAVERFNASLDYSATLKSIAREMVPVLADWCAIDLLEGDDLERVAVAHVDPTKVALVEEIERRYPPDPSVQHSRRMVMQSGKPYLMPVIPEDMVRAATKDAAHLELIERLRLHSIVVVPMIGRHGPLGALSLVSAESRRVYTEEDVAFACALADRAALAIENARLVRALEATVEAEKRAREQAEQAAKFSEMFLGVVGHDLRSPLNAIGTGAHVILRAATDDRLRRPAARIVESSRRMARMIEQLLDLTRIRMGRGISVDPAATNLGELVRQIAEEVEAAYGGAIELERVGDTSGFWDSDRLGQVVSNLLANAATHGTSGGTIVVRLDGTAPDTMSMQIRNDGQVPSETLPRIFEPFRGSKYQRGAAQGLGLGLYITREIVRAHGGTIDVTSSGGQTTFDVRLPRETRAV